MENNFDNKKDAHFYLNTTKKKSLRFITGVPRYLKNDVFLQFSRNQGRNKKVVGVKVVPFGTSKAV